ncbi:MAG: hypothetical protein AAGI38_08345 [Bacteroidota bacterium]
MRIWLVSLVCIRLLYITCYGQNPPEGTSSALFQSNEEMPITLVANWPVIWDDVETERAYHPGKLIYTEPNGQPDTLAVLLRTRGNFRRNKSNCSFPPIRVKMNDSAAVGTPFEGLNKIKLVTHCQKRAAAEQQVYLEYLCYRMYNVLTPESYHARLLKVTYQDSANAADTLVKPGFFIEPTKEMGKRLGGAVMKNVRLNSGRLDQDQINLMAVYQYMIANTDWSITVGHNVKLFARNDANPPLAIPYDFDWSGIVGAPYARPNPVLPIQSVRERLYRGSCQEEALFKATFSLFMEKKAEILSIFDEVPMEPKVRAKSMKFLEPFFKLIQDDKAYRKVFEAECRRG